MFSACDVTSVSPTGPEPAPGPPVVTALEGLGGGSLRGIAVRDADTVWVSGIKGTVRRS